MKLWVETGSVAEVEQLAAWGVLAGATTSRRRLDDAAIVRICDLIDASVSVDLVGDDAEQLVADGLALVQLHEHVVPRLACTAAGLVAASALSEQEIAVELTHAFAAGQALLAAEAGAALVSTALSPLEDASIDAGETLQAIVESLHGGETTAQVLVGGIRNPQQVVLAARLGAENASVPAAVLRRMLEHPLTAAAVERAQTP
ncbi:transaldolase family protein [Conexibacter sp. CPCC 206217]|uniref:transaldolase family protein n=1 Tax=Conexibacter sp. CPCC 206217 TaxID=3064574 RepID=UPI002727BEBC|nr:transaldolase family protein [Conexibacter sp. CPCC 206217]MDO8212686.1 transaldolase family protein [Conexibacter sp. CPCC 206217]